MPEKPPQFERPPVPVLGKASQEEKEKLSREIGRRFAESEITDLAEDLINQIQASEKAKEGHHSAYIQAANNLINAWRKKYGLEEFNVPEKSIHLVPGEIFERFTEKKLNAFYNHIRQMIMVNMDQTSFSLSRLNIASTLLHEMIHLKGFVSFDIKEEGDRIGRGIRRMGFISSEGFASADKHEYHENFLGLNEAVVSELENRFSWEIASSSQDPETRQELEWLASEEARKMKEEVARKYGVRPEEIEWTAKDGKFSILRSYGEQRRVLRYIIDTIAEDTGKDPEAIFEIFFKAHFTGQLIGVGRLIEKSFGKMSFRAVGMMGDTKESANQTLDYLKKLRIVAKNKDNTSEEN